LTKEKLHSTEDEVRVLDHEVLRETSSLTLSQADNDDYQAQNYKLYSHYRVMGYGLELCLRLITVQYTFSRSITLVDTEVFSVQLQYTLKSELPN